MKYLRQMLIILATYFIGQIIQVLFGLPVPGSVIGLILLFIALEKEIIKPEMIEDTCEFLLSNMSFLFIPAGVGLLTSLNVLKGHWVGFMAILIFSTVIVWVITVSVVKWLSRGKSNS